MRYYNRLFCTIQIVYHKNNTINTYKVKKIHINGYNKYFITQKFNLFNKSIFTIKNSNYFISYNTRLYVLSYIENVKKIGYAKMITHLDLINTNRKYQIMNLDINPILHKIVINNYKKLKFPITIIKKKLFKQLGVPINYVTLNNFINFIRKWYIIQGFYWVQINWKYNTSNASNIITINIYEGEIYKIFIYCEDAIRDKNFFIQQNKMNSIITQSLNLYKKNILNRNDLEQGIQKLQKNYGIKNIKYNIQYNNEYKKLIVTIKYKFIDIQYFSSFKILLNSFIKNYIYCNTQPIYKSYILNNHIAIYLSKLSLLLNTTNTQLHFNQDLKMNTTNINIICPYIYFYKNFIIQYTTNINYNKLLPYSEEKKPIYKRYYLTSKKCKTHIHLKNFTNIKYNQSNVPTINQYIIFHNLQFIKKYIQIYNNSNNLLKQYKIELGASVLSVINYLYESMTIYNKNLSLNISYILFQFFIKIYYIHKNYIVYLNNFIYIKYKKSIIVFNVKSFQNNLILVFNCYWNVGNQSMIPEYLLTRFYYLIQNTDRRYPMNITSIIYKIQLNYVYSLYAFVCYIPSYLYSYHTKAFFLHKYNTYGFGIKLNLNKIIKQIPQINIEYSVNSHTQAYFHIYATQ